MSLRYQIIFHIQGDLYIEQGLLKQESVEVERCRPACLGQKTVANYATQIKKKRRVTTSVELAHIAVHLGLLQK